MRFKPEDLKPHSGSLSEPKISDDMKCILRVGSKCISVVEEQVGQQGVIHAHLLGAAFDSEGDCRYQVVAMPSGLSLAEASQSIVKISKTFFDAGCDYVAVVALAVGAMVEVDELSDLESPEVQGKIREIAAGADGVTVDELFGKDMKVLVSVMVMSQYSQKMWFASLRQESGSDGRFKMAIDGPWKNGGESSDVKELLRQVRASLVEKKTKSKPSLN